MTDTLLHTNPTVLFQQVLEGSTGLTGHSSHLSCALSLCCPMSQVTRLMSPAKHWALPLGLAWDGECAITLSLLLDSCEGICATGHSWGLADTTLNTGRQTVFSHKAKF